MKKIVSLLIISVFAFATAQARDGRDHNRRRRNDQRHERSNDHRREHGNDYSRDRRQRDNPGRTGAAGHRLQPA